MSQSMKLVVSFRLEQLRTYCCLKKEKDLITFEVLFVKKKNMIDL